MKILILCTGNSCRSQMAEGFLKSFMPEAEVFSAGTIAAKKVHPASIQVMQEIGYDISLNHPKPVEDFLDQTFDYLITVCDEASESCPSFSGKVFQRLHIGFNDPAKTSGSEVNILEEFRRVRDEIRVAFQKLKTKIA